MDLEEATKLAKAHVGAGADVVHCIEPPGIYRPWKPDAEFLFRVAPRYPLRVGGSDFVVVDVQTRTVRFAGRAGE
jgi:hypothetical protein